MRRVLRRSRLPTTLAHAKIHMERSSLNKLIVITLTENHLAEGGRPRDPDEVYFTINSAQREWLLDATGGERAFILRTPDGRKFDMLLSGNAGKHQPGSWKNLRSRPATALGRWLKRDCHACPGDRVRIRDLGNGSLLIEHVPMTSIGTSSGSQAA